MLLSMLIMLSRWGLRGLALVVLVLFVGPVLSATADEPEGKVPVAAQESVATESPEARDAPDAIEEIVVTSRKREERLQDVPVAVSAFSAEDLSIRSVFENRELTRSVPNLTFENVSGSTYSKVYIRGVGQEDFTPTRDQGVGIYVDGVYLARMTGGLFDVIDLERVEALRGPQGVTFGRNTVGGAIDYITRKPQPEFEAYAEAGLGNQEQVMSKLMLNVPIGVGSLAEKLFLRLNLGLRNDEGYLDNIFDGSHFATGNNRAVRAALRFIPNDRLDINVSYDYSRSRTKSPIAKCFYIDPPAPQGAAVVELAGLFGIPYQESCDAVRAADYHDVDSQLAGKNDVDTWSSTAIIDYDLGEVGFLGELSLKSITAWRAQEYQLRFDDDMSRENIGNEFLLTSNREDQLSQEIQFTGIAADGRLNYVAGLYWFREVGDFNDDTDFFADIFGPERVGVDETATASSLAGFAEFTYDLTDSLSVTAGVRRTADYKEIDIVNEFAIFAGDPVFVGKGSDRFQSWTPRFNVRFRPNDDLMFYAGYSRGFRSGGFNGFLLRQEELDNPFESETLDSFEAGVKVQLFENRVIANGVFYYGEYDDIQLIAFGESGQGTEGGGEEGRGIVSTVRNAGKATISGIELELTALVASNLRIEGQVGTTWARYDEFDDVDPDTGGPIDRAGLHFANAPALNFGLGGDYRASLPMGELIVRADWYHQSKTYYDVQNSKDAQQNAYGLLNGRISLLLPDGKTEIALWGKNLLDRNYANTAFRVASFNNTHVYAAPPRRYGISVSRSFDSEDLSIFGNGPRSSRSSSKRP